MVKITGKLFEIYFFHRSKDVPSGASMHDIRAHHDKSDPSKVCQYFNLGFMKMIGYVISSSFNCRNNEGLVKKENDNHNSFGNLNIGEKNNLHDFCNQKFKVEL